MANIFQHIKGNKPPKSGFDLSHERKFTGNMGDLIPILVQEVVPGDKFSVNTEMLIRLAPMTAPVMHRINAYTHYFFVPNRLVHKEWPEYISGGEDGLNQTVLPFIKAIENSPGELKDLLQPGCLSDYMGLPSFTSYPEELDMEVNALPFRAYQLIYNEFYRDQNLQDKIDTTTNSGQLSDSEAILAMTMRKRDWEKDYFTSALPWPQKGEPVLLPLAGQAQVKLSKNPALGPQNFERSDGGNIDPTDVQWSTWAPADSPIVGLLSDGDNNELKLNPNGTMFADLSTVTNTTVNDLREAFQIQKWLERNARAGSRYIESILSHFGVRTSDYRLQRPEYLGGGKSPIVISEVLQTSQTSEASPQGNMSGHGYGVGNTNSFNKSFEEHGYIIGLMSVLPTTAYSQGIPKHFLRKDKLDFYWPEFANLGEQEIENSELYFDFNSPETNKGVFGYQQRYAEYRYTPSSVHGEFKTSFAHWHMGRKFANRPVLNDEFVESSPTHDIFAVTDPDEHKLYIQIYNNIKAVRPMPYMAEPGFIDHN